MQGKRISALVAFWLAAVLQAVWAAPIAMAETAADHYDESDDPSTGFLYGSIAYLNGDLYFFSDAEDCVLLRKPLSGGPSVEMGTVYTEMLMDETTGIGYHVSSVFLLAWKEQLYLINPYNGRWYSLLNDQGEMELKEQSVRLDMDVMMEKDED